MGGCSHEDSKISLLILSFPCLFMAMQGFSLVVASGGDPTRSSLVAVLGRLLVAAPLVVEHGFPCAWAL